MAKERDATMSVKIIKGNIFASKAQTIVNTVNCVGVMGAGIALEHRLRYPEMYKKYTDLCARGKLEPGLLWIYTTKDRWILNFPTKVDWKHPSRPEYLEAGLRKFAATYKSKKITSIAFPLLGADKGKLNAEVSLGIMRRHLDSLEGVDIEIYEYDPRAPDDLFEQLKATVLGFALEDLSSITGIAKNTIAIVISALQRGEICQISQMRELTGVGPATMEKLFRLSFNDGAKQGSLL
jgi:O-acetyl-ADP-ribose deacetylase (regulator of RNase III)